MLRKGEPHFEERKGNYTKGSRRFGRICFKVFQSRRKKKAKGEYDSWLHSWEWRKEEKHQREEQNLSELKNKAGRRRHADRANPNVSSWLRGLPSRGVPIVRVSGKDFEDKG